MIDAVLPFLETWSYLGLLAILLACGMGLPLPEDIPLLVSGWLVHRGHADLWLMILVAMFGVLGGDSIMYAIGRHYGKSVVEHPRLAWFITPARLDWAERQFLRRGSMILFAARFMAGARSVIYLTSGVFRMPYWKFVAIDGAAAVISVPLWIVLGAIFGKTAEEYIGDVKKATYIILAVLAVVLVAWCVYEWRKIKRMRADERAHALVHPHPAEPADPTGQPSSPALRTGNAPARADGAAPRPHANPAGPKPGLGGKSIAHRGGPMPAINNPPE